VWLRRRLWLWNAQGPRETEYDGASLRTSQSTVLIVVFEKAREILCGKYEIRLNANRMH
jgi:hypothetical protein